METIARGSGIRELETLNSTYGTGEWIKKKGVAMVRAPDGLAYPAEVHWYEAHGIGKVKWKVKKWLDSSSA